MNLFFFYKDTFVNNSITLSKIESNHCIAVLRKKVGEQVTVINGKGENAKCKIIIADKKKCKLKIISKTNETQKKKIHIAVAPPKNSSKTEFIVEKLTEIGISEISFIRAKNSEQTKINLEKLKNISISALKQSQNLFLPKINDIVKLETFLKQDFENYSCFIASLTENENSIKHEKNNLILIGAEGGFTDDEIKLCKNNGFSSFSLGKQIFRTETAAILTGHTFFSLVDQNC